MDKFNEMKSHLHSVNHSSTKYVYFHLGNLLRSWGAWVRKTSSWKWTITGSSLICKRVRRSAIDSKRESKNGRTRLILMAMSSKDTSLWSILFSRSVPIRATTTRLKSMSWRLRWKSYRSSSGKGSSTGWRRKISREGCKLPLWSMCTKRTTSGWL